MQIQPYQLTDYEDLIDLYKQSNEFKFDEITDSRENITRKIERDPESILLAKEDDELVGSVSIIEDGRIALLFRFVTKGSDQDNDEILKALLHEAETILKRRGYTEVHNTAPLEDIKVLTERERIGFQKGNPYMWYWKKIT